MANADALRARVRMFGVRVAKCVQRLPRGVMPEMIARQLARAGTSVGANFLSACRGRSRAEFIARLAIVADEADETVYWLELLHATHCGERSDSANSALTAATRPTATTRATATTQTVATDSRTLATDRRTFAADARTLAADTRSLAAEVEALLSEARELRAIFTKSVRTARAHTATRPPTPPTAK